MIIKRIYLEILRYIDCKKYAKKLGVKFGKDCRFSRVSFGSEPYLVSIGEHVLISSGCKFVTHEGAHWVLKGLSSKYDNTFGYGQIKIENNVYIGLNVTILRGVTIGKNTIIGACSLVNHSCEPNSVYAGVPARKICSLYEWKEKFLADMPKYDLNNYKLNKKEEVLKIVKLFKKR